MTFNDNLYTYMTQCAFEKLKIINDFNLYEDLLVTCENYQTISKQNILVNFNKAVFGEL